MGGITLKIYLYLALAVIAEIIATSALKPAMGFTKILPSVVVVLGYAAAFYLLSLVFQVLPVGITYAIWSGMGIVLITLVGAVVFKQIPDLPAIIGMALIVAGVVVIQVFSNFMEH